MAATFCPHCGVAREHGLYCTSCGQRYEERSQTVLRTESEPPSGVTEKTAPGFFQRVIKFCGYLFLLVLIVFMFAIGAGSIMIWSMIIGAIVSFLWKLTKRG